MKHPRFFIAAFMVLAFLGGCADDGESPPQTGIVSVKLTDAPAEYEEVNVTFSEIAISREGGWVAVQLDTAVTINLLDWNNGETIEIGRAELEPGKVTQVRLMIDRANVLVDSGRYPLDIPSSAQTGLKLNVNFEIVAGVVYELIMDFDANESVNITGTGEFKMNPVIRVVEAPITGAIQGSVTNPDSYTLVKARDATGAVVTTTVADAATGYFQLAYLEAGTYSVSIENQSDENYIADDVDVAIGQVTDIGSITLQ